MRKTAAHQKRVQDAALLLDIADRELSVALGEFTFSQRAEKQMISRELLAALNKVLVAPRPGQSRGLVWV